MCVAVAAAVVPTLPTAEAEHPATAEAGGCASGTREEAEKGFEGEDRTEEAAEIGTFEGKAGFGEEEESEEGFEEEAEGRERGKEAGLAGERGGFPAEMEEEEEVEESELRIDEYEAFAGETGGFGVETGGLEVETGGLEVETGGLEVETGGLATGTAEREGFTGLAGREKEFPLRETVETAETVEMKGGVLLGL